MKSKILISSWGGSRKIPSAFTEKGLYMLATIIKSPTATQTTLAIVETFAKIREFAKIVTELPDIKEEPKKTALLKKCGDLFRNTEGRFCRVHLRTARAELSPCVPVFNGQVQNIRDFAFAINIVCTTKIFACFERNHNPYVSMRSIFHSPAESTWQIVCDSELVACVN